MEVKMGDKVVCCFLFFVTLFEMTPNYKTSAQGSSHAFVQGNNDMRYLTDGIPVTMHKELSSVSMGRVPTLDERSIYSSQLHLKFEPPHLDFKQRYLGIPHHEKVTLFNVNNNKTIHMSSISGNTVHFHSSFFEDKVIPPMGNTSFNVVFLGREEGEIESNLFIHTSEGSFKYQVKGASISSPYRLRPLVGVKIPANATYSPLIYMHNPHSTPLQITEVYSSGGDFHLELPSGELEGPKHLWEIPPYHTKAVIRIRFVARAEKNHTAYVRIKVNQTEDVLVVPLDVEVMPQAGLYSPDDVIDFGIGGSKDKPKRIPLYLFNSGKKLIRLQSIATTMPSKAVKIEFQPIKVLPDTKMPTKVAVLTFDWKAAFEGKDYNGKIIIRSKQNQHQLIIPYMSQVLEGGLDFNSSVTQYCSDIGGNSSARNFTVKNTFKIPIALINVTLHKEARAYFMVQNFTPTVIIPDKTTVLFQLSLKQHIVPPDLKLETYLYLHTNVSVVTVPLLYYNGKLEKVIITGQNETELNFGTVGSSSQREAHFALLNNNPVAVNLKMWGTNLTGGAVELLGVEEGNQSSVLRKHSFKNMSKSQILKPGFFAVFRVVVVAPEMEGILEAEVFVQTQFEKVVLSAKMRVAHGKLEVVPEPVIFDDCFPGKLCVQQLHVRSLFSHTMMVTGITSVPPDPRVTYIPPETGGGPIYITELLVNSVGDLCFEPGLKCGVSKCYTGIPYNSSEGKQWLHSLTLPFHCQDSDLSQLNYRYGQFLSLTKETNAWKNLTFRLDTTEVRGHIFHASVHLVWPRIVSSAQSKKFNVEFPLTQVGDTVFKDLTLHNPSSQPILVQLAMEGTYPQANRMLDSLSPRFYPRTAESGERTLKQFVLENNAENIAHIEKLFGINVHPDSLPFLLQPGERISTKIGFAPTKSAINSAVLFVRNNLTILEVLRISGRATQAQFKFGNRKPGSDEPLMFELSKKHLRDCEREKNRRFPAPNLTVKRSFTARNTGELPIYISGFRINGLPCEGYGFRILNCAAFHLQPNGTRKIDIAFTPDFTLARVHRILGIDTSLGISVNYSLIATIPPYFLATCSSVLGRPTWEPLVYYTAVSFMVFLLLCVLTAAYLESDRILKCTVVNIKQEKAHKSSLDARIPTSSPADIASTSAQKCNEKSHTKLDAEWNANNPPLVPSHEKQNTDLHSPQQSHNSSSSKSYMWNTFEGKQNSTDGLPKDHPTVIKYDDVDAGYSTSSTPLLSVRHRKKLSKKNSNNSEASSLSETVQENVSVKKGWSNMYIRQNTPPTQSGKSRLNLAEPKVPINSTIQEPEMIQKTKRTLEVVKENKKSTRLLKKGCKLPVEPVKCYEEETSSTTTESSNNEETEKERSSSILSEKPQKTSPKKEKSKASYYKDNYEGDCDDDDYERENHKKKDLTSRWKNNFKVISKTVNELPQKSINEDLSKLTSLETIYKPKSSKTSNRERKEKNVLKRRAAAEKTAHSKIVSPTTLSPTNTVPSSSTTTVCCPLSPPAAVTQSSVSQKSPPIQPPSPPQTQPQPQPQPQPQSQPQQRQQPQVQPLPVPSPVPVPAPAACWGESKATFSDVVARNESPLYSSIVAPRKQNEAAVSSSAASPEDRKGSPPVCESQVNPEAGGITSSSSGSGSSLGPVGSKPRSCTWDGNKEFQAVSQHPNQEKSVPFLDSFTDQAQQSDDSLGGLPYTDSSWEQDNTVAAVFEDGISEEASPKSPVMSDSWPMMDALWKPLYTPPQPLESHNDSLFSDVSVTAKNKTDQSYSPWGPSNSLCIGSVWSSSAWSTGPGPVAPPLTTPAPILPPVAPVHAQGNTDGTIEDEPPSSSDLDRGLGFDPFTSLNAIWFPRPAESWNPPANN
ncbi:transmembrane protein 131 isoform X2 [Schistocerca gregaria]|uniref:transmembrane protein 131 isoform X2 n=1 Tax=Schistocerca gregaria TaxID=7010 RepID=UPI00211E25E9|nr:transmembrane protein 131 isoform X2 [Schistocerca gregaria]